MIVHHDNNVTTPTYRNVFLLNTPKAAGLYEIHPGFEPQSLLINNQSTSGGPLAERRHCCRRLQQTVNQFTVVEFATSCRHLARRLLRRFRQQTILTAVACSTAGPTNETVCFR